MLPVELPEMTDFEPRILADDDPSLPEPPLARADDWVHVELDLGDGAAALPARDEHDAAVGGLVLVLPALPRPHQRRTRSSTPRSSATGWATAARGGVDLYVGGAEHAVLHLLYARFWHKVLFDLGHVSTPEPFHRLFNQGTITAAAFTDERGMYVEAAEVEERDGAYFVRRRSRSCATTGKMGKSLKNAVAPDDIYRDYGADTLRLYEMFMGPLDAEPAVEHRRHRRRAPVPAAVLAQRGRRGHRRAARRPTRRPTTRPAALLHRTIDAVARRHGHARVQHRDRARCSS